MTKNLLALVGALAILAIVCGAAYKTFALPPSAPFQQPAPKPISQIPITQHFSMNVQLNHISASPLVIAMPPGVGMAISQFTMPMGGSADVIVRINGAIVFKGLMGFTYGNEVPPFVIPINPPLIVRPGQILELGTDTGGREATISGYVLSSADFGQ